MFKVLLACSSLTGHNLVIIELTLKRFHYQFMQIFFSIFKYQATFSKSFTIKLLIEKQYFNAFQNLWVIAFIDCKVLKQILNLSLDSSHSLHIFSWFSSICTICRQSLLKGAFASTTCVYNLFCWGRGCKRCKNFAVGAENWDFGCRIHQWI